MITILLNAFCEVKIIMTLDFLFDFPFHRKIIEINKTWNSIIDFIMQISYNNFIVTTIKIDLTSKFILIRSEAHIPHKTEIPSSIFPSIWS